MGNPWTWPPNPGGAAIAQTIYQQAPGMVSLSVPPALLGQAAGALDAEMDSDPGWQYYDFGLPGARAFSGVPNWDARIAGVSPAISFTQRKSFVTLQPGNNSAATFEACYVPPTPVTWLANTAKWYWCGHAVGWEYLQDYRHALGIFAGLAGSPDRQNCTLLGNIDVGAGMSPLTTYSYAANALGGPSGGVAANVGQIAGSHWPYFAIYLRAAATRAGVTLEKWVFNDHGQRVRLFAESFSQIGATYFPGFYIRSAATGSGGGIAPATGYQPGIFQADFFRELTGPTPPWARG